MTTKELRYAKIGIAIVLVLALAAAALIMYSGNVTMGDGSSSTRSMNTTASKRDESVSINIGGNSTGDFNMSKHYNKPDQPTTEHDE